MKVVLLGSKDTFHLSRYIESSGDTVICEDGKVSLGWMKKNDIEFIVSYGYGFILKNDIIEAYKGKAINLHISYLPWGRGRSPLFWDLMEGNPTGVTIHFLDSGIDTGDIILQERIHLGDSLTFREAFAIVRDHVERLFYCFWGIIRMGQCSSFKQVGVGTYHKPEEMKGYKHLLYDGWDTPIKSFAKVIPS
jgi:methionyl-tRNA formyltransferase